MSKGDVVFCARDSKKYGIVLAVNAGAFATWVSVMWADDIVETREANTLRLLSAKR